MPKRRTKAATALTFVLTGVAQAADAVRALPTELSPLAMFLQADIIVKAVMVSLAFASVLTWVVLIAKRIEISAASSRLSRVSEALGAAIGLEQSRAAVGPKERIAGAMVAAAEEEIRLTSGAEKSAIKDRIALRLSRTEQAAAREMTRGLSILATIGATAPFVGLFGTVWGIMNSFIGISKSQTTNLAVVAPGIAEALLATAIGLVAAIPAVIFYNHLTRSVSGYKAKAGDVAALVLLNAARDLDRVPGPSAGVRKVA